MSNSLIDGWFYWTGVAIWALVALFVLVAVLQISGELLKSARMTAQYYTHAGWYKMDKHLLWKVGYFFKLTWDGATCSNMECSWKDKDGNTHWLKWRKQ